MLFVVGAAKASSLLSKAVCLKRLGKMPMFKHFFFYFPVLNRKHVLNMVEAHILDLLYIYIYLSAATREESIL